MVAAAVVSALLGSAACRAADVESNAATCPSQTFDLRDRAEPLGSSDALIEAFDAAAERQVNATTMMEMTSSVGWSPDWDQVIYLGALTTDEILKRKVSADLDLACFTNLPQESGNSDQPSPHVTVFMAAGKPVQAVWWWDADPRLRFGKREFLLPDTAIRYDPATGKMKAE